MENEKVKVTIEYGDGKSRTFEGKAVVGTIIGVGDRDDRSAGMFVGKGDSKKLLIKAAISLCGMVRDVIEGEFAQLMVAGVMSKLILDAAAGDDDLTETISKEFNTAKED